MLLSLHPGLNMAVKLERDAREFMLSSGLSVAAKILAAMSGVLFTLVISRALGASEAGVFFLAYAFAFVLAAIARIGLDHTLVRFIGADHALGRWPNIVGLFNLSVRWVMLVSVPAAAVLVFLANPIARSVFGSPELAPVLRIIAAAIPLMALFNLYANGLFGRRRVTQATLTLGVVSPLATIALVLVFRPDTAAYVALLFVVACVFGVLWGAAAWLRELPRTAGASPHATVVLASCLPLLTVVIFNQVLFWIAQVLLGVYFGSAEVAIFNAAQRTALLTSFILMAVNIVVAPRFAAQYRSGDFIEIRKLAITAARISAFAAIPPLVIVMFASEEIMSLFGDGFRIGYRALQILTIGEFINAATGSVGILLTMTGHERDLRNNVMVAAAVSVALSLALIPSLGLLGGAIATAVAGVVQNFLGVFQVRRRLGFYVLPLARLK